MDVCVPAPATPYKFDSVSVQNSMQCRETDRRVEWGAESNPTTEARVDSTSAVQRHQDDRTTCTALHTDQQAPEPLHCHKNEMKILAKKKKKKKKKKKEIRDQRSEIRKKKKVLCFLAHANNRFERELNVARATNRPCRRWRGELVGQAAAPMQLNRTIRDWTRWIRAEVLADVRQTGISGLIAAIGRLTRRILAINDLGAAKIKIQ
jgi:hypothetical protein